jgi:hypothetical protein
MCKEFFEKTADFLIDNFKSPVPVKTLKGEDCHCVETINCGKEEYCIFVKCPRDDKPFFIFNTILKNPLEGEQSYRR